MYRLSFLVLLLSLFISVNSFAQKNKEKQKTNEEAQKQELNLDWDAVAVPESEESKMTPEEEAEYLKNNVGLFIKNECSNDIWIKIIKPDGTEEKSRIPSNADQFMTHPTGSKAKVIDDRGNIKYEIGEFSVANRDKTLKACK